MGEHIVVKYSKRLLIRISAAILVIILIIVGYIFYQNQTYKSAIYSMLSPTLSYNDSPDIYTTFDADYAYHYMLSKKQLYFDKIDEEQNHITIVIPSKATLTVYPNDDQSVLLHYKPHKGISRNYKLSGYGDFNKHLRLLYELTDNEIFNETIDLPKAED